MANHHGSVYRYERKFFVSSMDRSSIESSLRHHPALFSEIFHPRFVNNIYLDTLDFTNFMDNIDGNVLRTKYRVRWYRALFGQVERPVLELKIKKGAMGTKKSYLLSPFALQPGIGCADIQQFIGQSEIPQAIKWRAARQRPVLVNRYKRSYFLSADKKFRVTIDDDQSFLKVQTLTNQFLQKKHDPTSVIVELKYNREDDMEAHRISSLFPFRVSKSSKYARGIELLYY